VSKKGVPKGEKSLSFKTISFPHLLISHAKKQLILISEVFEPVKNLLLTKIKF